MTQLNYIPLAQLQVSKLNARQTGGKNVDNLAASIAADGLLQNLTVTTSKKEGMFDVVAGARRLRALQLLTKEGRLDADYQVPCRVVDIAVAQEASTAENTIREAMNPADEIMAYAKLAKAKKSVTDIAVRFGQTERHVQGMLKLSTVSPKILDLLRADEIRLDQVKALTLTDDHARQEEVWSQAGEWNDEPEEIRAVLTEQELTTTCRLAKAISLDAYQAAGGGIRQDLFGEQSYLDDPDLARSMAQALLDKKAASLLKNKGYAWVETVPLDHAHVPYGKTNKLERLRSSGPELVEDRKLGGTFVYINNAGKVCVEEDYIRPGDRQRAERGDSLAPNASGTTAAKPAPRDDFSRAQVEFLVGTRTAIARAALHDQHRFMLAALAATLATDVILDGYDDAPIKLHGRFYGNTGTQAGVEAFEATNATFDQAGEAWRAKLAGCEGFDDVLRWLLERSESITQELLAYCAASYFHLGDAESMKVLSRAHVDMTQWWQPTGDWLETLSKPTLLRIVRETLGDDSAAPLANLRKPDLVPKVAELLEGSGYLPETLRLPVAALQETGQ